MKEKYSQISKEKFKQHRRHNVSLLSKLPKDPPIARTIAKLN